MERRLGDRAMIPLSLFGSPSYVGLTLSALGIVDTPVKTLGVEAERKTRVGRAELDGHYELRLVAILLDAVMPGMDGFEIGLTISRLFAGVMGGDIQVTSMVGTWIARI
jgi:CheY-like chemotaxis protein